MSTKLLTTGKLTFGLKGTVSRLCAHASVICFLPDHTADGDLLFIFSSNILDFRRNLSCYLKFGSLHEDSSRFYRQQGRLAIRKSLSARFKNRFSNVKLVLGVNCSKSSNICLICSRSSLKRWKDKNKNAISML